MKRLIIAITALVFTSQMAMAAPLGHKGLNKGKTVLVKVHSAHGKKFSKNTYGKWYKAKNKKQVRRTVKKRWVNKRGRRFYGRGKPAHWQKRGCWKLGPVWYCPAH